MRHEVRMPDYTIHSFKRDSQYAGYLDHDDYVHLRHGGCARAAEINPYALLAGAIVERGIEDARALGRGDNIRMDGTIVSLGELWNFFTSPWMEMLITFQDVIMPEDIRKTAEAILWK